MTTSEKQISCIILAGGEGKRVGGRDKGLVAYNDKPLIEHVLDAVSSQCNDIIISAKRNVKAYKTYGYPVIADEKDDYLGPLAGIAASLPHCKNDTVLIVPCDMPCLPANLTTKLLDVMASHTICIAETDGRTQLAFLMNKNLLPSIIHALENNERRLMQWVKSQNPKYCLFSKSHYFKNFNESKDLL